MAITLRACRINADLTQEEAAQRLKITPLTLSNYEKGKRFPNVPMIKEIEKLYGVSYKDIIFFQKNTE